MPPRIYARLDASFNTDEKIVDLPMAARGLYVSLLAWSKAHGKDGLIPQKIPKMLCAQSGDNHEPLVAELTGRELLVTTDDGYSFPAGAYRDWQVLNHDVEQVRANRREAGSIGGQQSGQTRQAQAAERQRLEDGVPRTITDESCWAHFQAARKRWPQKAPENEDEVYAAYAAVVRTEEEASIVNAAVDAYVHSMRGWSVEMRRKATPKLKVFVTTGKWRDYVPSHASNDNAAAPAVEPVAPRQRKSLIDEVVNGD